MRSILVTGANKGIGLAITAAALRSQPDTLVFMGSRSAARGESARQQCLSANPDWEPRLVTLELDVTDADSIARASTTLLSHLAGDSLYGLVNNAGMAVGSVAEVLDVNLHGIRRVCDEFIPRLQPGGRLVNVTSASGPNFVATCSPERQAFFCSPDIDWEELSAFTAEAGELGASKLELLGLGSDSPYGFSKACANSYTLWLAKQHPALLVNACTPGFIETDLGKAFLGGRTPAQAGMKSPDAGARVIMELLFGEARGSGHYYGSDALRSPMDRYRAPGSPEYKA